MIHKHKINAKGRGDSGGINKNGNTDGNFEINRETCDENIRSNRFYELLKIFKNSFIIPLSFSFELTINNS